MDPLPLQQNSGAQPIRLTFGWLLLLFALMVLFGVGGGFVSHYFFPTPLPLPTQEEQLVTTVQQITVSPAKQRDEVIQQVTKSLVLLTVKSGDTHRPLGMGTIITNDGYIVTPTSVVTSARAAEADTFVAVDTQGSQIPVTVIGTDTVWGLTYLKITSGVAVPVEIVSGEVPVGTLLTSIDTSFTSREVVVGSYELQQYILPPQDKAKGWQRMGSGAFTAPSFLAGVPLFTEDGKVAAWAVQPEEGVTLRAMDVKDSLDRIITGKREIDPLAVIGLTLTFAFEESAGSPAPVFTARVGAVVPGSIAAIAGVKVGDVLTHIQNQPVAWKENIVTRLGAALPLPVTFLQQGVERVVTLTPPS